MYWTVEVNACEVIYQILYTDSRECTTKNSTIFTELFEEHVRLPLLTDVDLVRYMEPMAADALRHTAVLVVERIDVGLQAVAALACQGDVGVVVGAVLGPRTDVVLGGLREWDLAARSEEHTSELQSH